MGWPRSYQRAAIPRPRAQPVVVVGYAILIVGISTYLLGRSFPVYLAAMVLLGVGWNFAFVGATAILSTGIRGPDGARAQAATDALAMGLLAIGVASSSVIASDVSWAALLIIHLCISAAGLAVSVFGLWLMAAKSRVEESEVSKEEVQSA